MAKKQPDKQAKNRKPNGQFAPGASGNPKGRPKPRTLSEAYRELLKQPLPNDQSRTYADIVAAALCKSACEGDVSAAKELADRTEGKAQAKLDVTHSDDQARREWAERQLEKVMESLKIEREEAVEWMRTNTPTAAQWIN